MPFGMFREQAVCRRTALPKSLLLLAAVATALWSIGQAESAQAAEQPSRPNIVFLLADDKYEHSQPKVDNTGKKRLKPAFHQEFQITWNCGKLGQITGN